MMKAMKHWKYTLFGLLSLFVVTSCQKEEDIIVATLTYSDVHIDSLYYSADISCHLRCDAPYKTAYLHYATMSDFSDYQECSLSFRESGVYTFALENLNHNQTYYVRYAVSNSVSSLCSKDSFSFRTRDFSAPVLTTILDTTQITYQSAVVGGKVLLDGGLPIVERGVVYSQQEHPTIESSKLVHTQGLDSFVCVLNDLEVLTTYYARAYAKNEKGISYGEEQIFTTLSTMASLGMVEATEITGSSVVFKGSILTDGGSAIEAAGFCYSSNEAPTLQDSVVISTYEGDSLHAAVAGLHRATTYYVCAYATNANGTAYSEQVKFTTDKALPILTTVAATNITSTSATVSGNVTDDGGAEVTERGVVYSTNQSPTTEDNKITSGSGMGSFSCNLTELQDGVTHYARAYAVNEKGTAYGEEVSFTTKAKTVATVSTTEPTSIIYTSAVVGGTVTDDGGAEVTERGVVYSTSQNPTTSDNKVTSGSGTGSFSCNLTELQVGVTYYARAYAVNEKGTTYGEEVSFTTKAKTVATVSTTDPMNVTYTSATVGGNVTDDGGAEVTERGVVYSTSQNPTTSDNKVTSGSGTGSFSCNLTELQDDVTYYARAYAVNEKGTAYGEEVSFTTLCPFSISSTRQVIFSSGNLQYHPANDAWRFAESQLDCIGDANSHCSSTYNGWIDLFGWSTSSTNFGVSTSTDYADYYGSFVDWGTNQIGDDAPNTWRTLTKDEWNYLLNNRPNASSLKGVAQVNGVNGLILLPDDWACPAGITFKSGFHSDKGREYYAAYQIFTADQWSTMEGSGAVFLPAAGYRSGSNVGSVQYYGGYWFATEYNSYNAYYLYFDSGGAGMGSNYRRYGRGVRLVKDL